MKDSGIPWIGEIPEGWGKDKIIRVFRTIGSGTTPKSTEESNFGGDINWIQSGDINGGVMSSCKNQVSEETLLNCPALKVYKFPFIIVAMYGASVGNTSISTIDGCVNQACCVLGDSVLNFKYAFSIIKSCKDYWLIKAIGGGQPNISQETIRQTWIPVPPLAEQHLIATFLDKKCSEIDSLIDLQEQMIEELKAYKQSVITEAVTKGLNPNVQMKDSGVEWIGDVPEHWEVKPLKFNFNRRSERNNPILTTERLSLSIDKGVTLYSEKTTNLDRFKDDFTQYQLAYPNDIILNCMNMIVGAVGLSKYIGCVSPVYYVIYPSNLGISAEYYSYLLNTPTIRGVYYSYGKGIYAIDRGEGRVNTCRLKVSYDDFGRFDIPIPPIEEQKEIVSCIKQKCADIDRLIELKQSKIEHLKEYKKSVIYEYVTGKREV
jgi:type I restriction enzyme S subunit